jgi:hypothetical protein
MLLQSIINFMVLVLSKVDSASIRNLRTIETNNCTGRMGEPQKMIKTVIKTTLEKDNKQNGQSTPWLMELPTHNHVSVLFS